MPEFLAYVRSTWSLWSSTPLWMPLRRLTAYPAQSGGERWDHCRRSCQAVVAVLMLSPRPRRALPQVGRPRHCSHRCSKLSYPLATVLHITLRLQSGLLCPPVAWVGGCRRVLHRSTVHGPRYLPPRPQILPAAARGPTRLSPFLLSILECAGMPVLSAEPLSPLVMSEVGIPRARPVGAERRRQQHTP